MSVVRDRPPGFAGGMNGSIRRYWSSLRAWPEPKSPTSARTSGVHIAASGKGVSPQGSPHFYLRMSPANRFDYSRQQMPSHELSQPPDSHPINAIIG